jgi:hypothetical protein
MDTDRSHMYRQLIDRVRMQRIAGLFTLHPTPAVGAVGILASFTDGL